MSGRAAKPDSWHQGWACITGPGWRKTMWPFCLTYAFPRAKSDPQPAAVLVEIPSTANR